MAPSAAWKPTSAVPDSGPKGVWMGAPTPGFQPVIAPVREAKRNTDAAVLVPSVTEKAVELPLAMTGWFGLNTWPVGEPPGMVTLKGWLSGVPLRSPRYSSLTPPPLDETQKAPPLGLSEMPQAFFRVASCCWASPGRSDTRLVCTKFADIRLRSSSASTPSRVRAGWRTGVRLRRPLSRNHFERERRIDIGKLL